MNEEIKNVSFNADGTKQYIFPGLTFNGPAVSKKEYLDHYEEYVQRCSNTRKDFEAVPESELH
ncbi:hypothetical protein [Lentilactobacillus sp. SPB1-3]|uniref:Uncharacterized protein n=1 Tax=Lentilactobacillus terminaliae TaxID=3003483 RepID=A0ACD5DDC7_9LACO|nr:hypothetical protein [Lentilactobacillus sp. SPB1-3]MCZ0978152.1 hypothetical protein [Lentilactobacillus sp. SPB1-3]